MSGRGATFGISDIAELRLLPDISGKSTRRAAHPETLGLGALWATWRPNQVNAPPDARREEPEISRESR